MPEIATQTEKRDTHQKVYTHCGEPGAVVASVIVKYRSMKGIRT